MPDGGRQRAGVDETHGGIALQRLVGQFVGRDHLAVERRFALDANGVRRQRLRKKERVVVGRARASRGAASSTRHAGRTSTVNDRTSSQAKASSPAIFKITLLNARGQAPHLKIGLLRFAGAKDQRLLAAHVRLARFAIDEIQLDRALSVGAGVHQVGLNPQFAVLREHFAGEAQIADAEIARILDAHVDHIDADAGRVP